jgi:predicted nuclease of restriction endonuclease-like (RecB) superfamily
MGSNAHISDYKIWIDSLKSKIKSARVKVALSVNSQLIELYWEIGKDISEKAKNAGWGLGVIEQISTDLKHEFPEMKGFSRRNLYAIKQWYEFYNKDFEFVPQPVAQILP